jgi:hypothetical protein
MRLVLLASYLHDLLFNSEVVVSSLLQNAVNFYRIAEHHIPEERILYSVRFRSLISNTLKKSESIIVMISVSFLIPLYTHTYRYVYL